MADFKTKIEAARAEGYTDDEIVNHLSTGDMAAKVKAARDEGYSPQEIVSHLGGQAAPTEKKPWYSAVTDPIQYGADQVTENFAATANAVGYTGAGQNLSDAVEAPKNYGKSYSEDFINSGKEGYNWSSLPGATLEQLPQMAGSVATRVVGAGAGMVAAGPAGAVAGGLLGPAAFEFVQVAGPVALKLAKDRRPDGVPTMEDWKQAAATAGVSGAMNAIGVAKIPGLNGILGKMMKETASETGQGVTEQVGSTLGTKGGLEVNLPDAFGEGMIGGTSAGTLAAPVATGRGLAAVNRAVKAPYEVEYQDGATNAGNRLKGIRDEMGLNTKDGDKNRYSNEAFNELAGTAHTQISEELKAAFSKLKPELQALDDGTVDGIMTLAEANAGIRDSKNKRKGVVTKSQYATLENAIGGTDIGNKALALIRESNELTRLTNRDPLGGLSGSMEVFNPFSGSGQEKALKTLTALAAGSQTGGLSTAAQIGAYGGARAIDKFTGRRYPYEKFINDFAGRDVPELGGESLQGIRDQQVADAQAASDAQRQAQADERQATQTAKSNVATTLRMRQQIERRRLREEREARRAESQGTQASNEATKADKEAAKAANDAFKANSDVIMRAVWDDPTVISQEWIDAYGSQLTNANYKSAQLLRIRNEANAAKEAAKAEGQKRDKEAVKAAMEAQAQKPVSDKAAMTEIGRKAAAIMKVAKMRQKAEAEATKKLAGPAVTRQRATRMAPRQIPAAQALGGAQPVNSNTTVNVPLEQAAQLPPPQIGPEIEGPVPVEIRDQPQWDAGKSENQRIEAEILQKARAFKGTALGLALEFVVYQTKARRTARLEGTRAVEREKIITEALDILGSDATEADVELLMDTLEDYRFRYADKKTAKQFMQEQSKAVNGAFDEEVPF